MSEMLMSIVICTQNRVESLNECLKEVIYQASAFSDVEIIVVDNGSTDNTRSVVIDLFSSLTLPCHYIYEERMGVSYARNGGRNAASGKIIAYTDDDAIPHLGWVAKIRQHFLEESSDYLAGRVELRLDAPLPGWFPESLLWVIGKSPFGDEPRVLESQCPQSANCAIRTDAFDAVGGYDPRISYYGEEVNFFYRVKAKGFITLYRPDIVVDHCVPAARLTKDALIRKADLMGRGAAHVATLPSVSIVDWVKKLSQN